MISGCKSYHGCVDAGAPLRATFGNRYKWPESDAEFAKSMATRRGGGGGGGGRADNSNVGSSGGRTLDGNGRRRSPAVVDSYSCRQMYMRSYQFSRRKETLQEKTLRCLGRVTEKGAASTAAAFPLFLRQKKESSGGGVNGDTNSKRRRRRRRTTSSSSSALCYIFHLLSRGAAVNVSRW